MELESLFVATKWDILQAIAYEPLSPMQLAKKLNTTIANISAQLRLLEASRLIKREKTGSAKAGKPRTLFSLANNVSYLTVLFSGLAHKELIEVDPTQQAIITTWTLPKRYQQPLLRYIINHADLL